MDGKSTSLATSTGMVESEVSRMIPVDLSDVQAHSPEMTPVMVVCCFRSTFSSVIKWNNISKSKQM